MGLYIQMHCMHGLTKSHHLELGRDEDTGGQILYVRYLALELAKMAAVEKVDIIVRRIIDPRYPGYSDRIEPVADKVNIVRIECGPQTYLKKVDLWPHIEEFVENCKKYIEDTGRMPDILHSHYAYSGFVCARLSQELGIPLVHTGHSLGKPKMARLGVTDRNYTEMDGIYHFTERFHAEQFTIDNADAIVVSTNEERLFQYNMYDVDINDGRFHIIPPGANLKKFYPSGTQSMKEWDLAAHKRLTDLLNTELREPGKPIIFTSCRLDYRNNLISLLKAFAYDKKLQETANLVMVTGTLGAMGKHEQILLEEMESIMRTHKIKDKICIIKHIEYKTEGGEIYRIVADSRGVFVNPAYYEPFGVTVLEAGATGLPVVATKNGGPLDIIERCRCGILIEPRDTKEISEACLKILTEPELWATYSRNGACNIKKLYSWEAAAEKELELFHELSQA